MALSDAKPCNATTKRTQRTCRNPAVLGSTKCRMHGGKSPAGAEAAQYKHGRYSAGLPTHLAARYRLALGDPNILDQRPEIAILQARLCELFQCIDAGEAGQWFRLLNKARAQYLTAKTEDKKREHLDSLFSLIERGAADYMIWNDIGETIEQRRKLVESQARADQHANLFLSLEKIVLIFGVIESLIHEYVPSRDARVAIADGLRPVFADLGLSSPKGEA